MTTLSYTTRNLPTEGYVTVEDNPGTESEPRRAVYKGPTATLGGKKGWLKTVQAAFGKTERLYTTLAFDGAITTVTLTSAGDKTNDTTTKDDVRCPTLTLSMGTYDRPIETLTTPTNFSTLTTKRIATLRAYAAGTPIPADDKLSDTEEAYVKLRQLGITTRAEPAYTCQVTRYIALSGTTFSVASPTAHTVATWESIIEFLGQAKSKYDCPDSNLLWLPIGVQVSIRESRYAEVSISYQGAYYFPKELYTGGN